MTGNAAARRQEFARGQSAWIVVRHFLSADLLEELCEVVVAEASRGKLALTDLFDTVRTLGPSAFSLWALRPRNRNGVFDCRVQDLVRTLVWQGDPRAPFAGSDLAPEDVVGLRPLVQGLEVGPMDLGSVDEAERFLGTATDTLQPILRVMVAFGRQPSEPDGPALQALARSLVDAYGDALATVLTKHLGDLHALADRWLTASALYDLAARLSLKAASAEWSDFIATLRDVIAQSISSAHAHLGDTQTALDLLDGLAEPGDLARQSVGVANSAPDILDLTQSASPGRWRSDRRTVLAAAPQILDVLDVSSAYVHWTDKNYTRAHRLFWATLRRQVAFGSAAYSRETRVAWGRSCIDACLGGLPRRERMDQFALGIQLLVEGERPDAVKLVSWTEPLVAAYVDIDGIEKVKACAGNVPGARRRRQAVVAALFGQWLGALSPVDVGPAGQMLAFLAEAARDPSASSLMADDLQVRAFECLAAVGDQRPEFCLLAAADVARSVVAGLGGNMLILTGALDVAVSFREAFDGTSLAELVVAVTELLERITPSQAPWTIARPAMSFLGSEQVISHDAVHEGLRDRIRLLLVRYALESDTEHDSLMFYLRDLHPEWINRHVDRSAVETVVSRLQQRASQNSSRSADEIIALLVAPGFAGRLGVEGALDSLTKIVTAATAGRSPLPFSRAYRAVMLIGDVGMSLGEKSGIPGADFDRLRGRLFDLLLELWRAAAANPAIFARFSFNPESALSPEPNVVHNWTFASIGFALSLDREGEMAGVLDMAEGQPQLREPMSVARSLRTPDEDPRLLDAHAIRAEARPVFYAALGRRLMLLGRLPLNVRDTTIRVLLERTFALGPRGMDAGVLAAAAAYGIRPAQEPGLTLAYKRRMENDTDLRLNLAPMLDRLFAQGEASPRSGPPVPDAEFQ